MGKHKSPTAAAGQELSDLGNGQNKIRRWMQAAAAAALQMSLEPSKSMATANSFYGQSQQTRFEPWKPETREAWNLGTWLPARLPPVI